MDPDEIDVRGRGARAARTARVVAPRGELDMATQGELRAALEQRPRGRA